MKYATIEGDARRRKCRSVFPLFFSKKVLDAWLIAMHADMVVVV